MRQTLLFLAILVVVPIFGQSYVPITDLPRPDAAWETSYKSRLNNMVSAWVAGYSVNGGAGSEDAGKKEWSKLLAKLAYLPSQTASLIQNQGYSCAHGINVGSFYKPFSCAGFAMYYFKYRDSILKYDPDQIPYMQGRVNGTWNYLLRTDHFFDACCGYNDAGGKEFNSENFHWMMRSTGFLFAHELHNKNIGGTIYDNTNRTVNIEIKTFLSTPKSVTKSVSGINLINFFNGFARQMPQSLYSTGRVEWNSLNYWGHTMNPLITWYENADKCNNPEAAKYKKLALSALDWMVLESAIHYQDGFLAAADARAKSGSFLPFKGSVQSYIYAYFAEDGYHPTFSPNVWQTKDPGVSENGFILNSSYRPAKILLDIAHRRFPLPVEIQRAIPFYHVDHGDYFKYDTTTAKIDIKGEYPYQHWKGATQKGRRFEFESIWIDENVTMASAAVGRPNGNLGTYSEQCIWRLAVKGQKNGARMLSGNGGGQYLSGGNGSGGGRGPYHAVGQYRNMMMQLVKHSTGSSNYIWFAIPDSLDQLASSGEGSFWDVQYYKWNGSDLYLNMGNDVYIAIKPYPTPTTSVTLTNSESSEHSTLKYTWGSNVLGCVVLEVGTGRQYGNFTNFYDSLKSKTIAGVATNTYEYSGGMNSKIKMEYVAPGSFTMAPYTNDYTSNGSYSPAGSYPKVWGDDVYIDFQQWDSYKTVYGEPILEQKWGSAELTINNGTEKFRVKIDTLTGDVQHYQWEDITSTQPCNGLKTLDIIVNNPVKNQMVIRFSNSLEQNTSLRLYAITGQLAYQCMLQKDANSATIDMSTMPQGIYLLRLSDGSSIASRKIQKK